MSNNLKIEIGSDIRGESKTFPDDRVRFVAEDGQTMFEVSVVSPNAIEVRAVQLCKVNGILRDSRPMIRPIAGNVVRISTQVYNDPS